MFEKEKVKYHTVAGRVSRDEYFTGMIYLIILKIIPESTSRQALLFHWLLFSRVYLSKRQTKTYPSMS
jgi:hypothetical protein